MAAHPSPRRPPPRRLSALRLSTDTTSSLPAYSSPPSTRPSPHSGWPNKDKSQPLDEPPDYPQSAEEADQEDDFVPLRLAATRRLRHRRRDSSSVPSSPSVDDLLERSVVALELSTNALLQSMDTQSRVSAIANDHVFERSLVRQTKMLDLRLRGTRATHEGWMDDLDDVMHRVNGLFDDQVDVPVSRSLPTGSSHIPRRRRHHQLPKSRSETPYLHMATSELDVRDTLRPPRALTQYVSVESTSGEAMEATADLSSIYMPSTTGLRSAAQVQSFTGTDPRPHGLRKSVSSPGPDMYSTPPRSAYNMLSHLASNHSPPRAATPASQSSPSVSDSATSRTVRRHSAGSFDSTFTFPLRRPRSTSRGRSSASVDAQTPPLPPVRAMTPPMEELTPSSSSESCSSDHKVHAFRTMQSLRKILDEAPDPKGKRPAAPERPPRRVFRPRTPAVAPSFGTSTATASVSRLLTRSSHHTSSSHHSRPKQSSLKQSNPQSLAPTPGTITPASQRSSTPGTPRQVSFADLPEAHSGRKGRKGKDKDKGKEKKGQVHEDGGWWSGWFTSTGGSAAARYDERMEDKAMRGWGRPGVGGGVADEWML
ncbi:hypothetical protein JB92DRAFT_3148131 [Gautieria morchelliformis]|nr:hypothetical protein JB92DRAFT_3148131 [Gautieria morchelliformis]